MNEKYIKHIFDNPVMQRPDLRGRVFDLHVCPKCERPLLGDKGWSERKIATCPKCGWSGTATRTIREHLKDV